LTPESESIHLVSIYTWALDICSLLAHGLQLTSKWPFFSESCKGTSMLPEFSGSANQKRGQIRPNLKIGHL
jgi:hypothetical protein